MKTAFGIVLSLIAASACADLPSTIPERHRPKLVMGKDYWTLLSSFWYSDPEFVKYGMLRARR